ncbi:MAG: DUF1501 domain-containing protein [Polyangiaceae bacterium]|nr:DUF1501 domain-containing protein [Polyangiaceae bacterium]
MARRPLLISIFLRGGADGLSLAQPLGSGLLKEARPTLATPDSELVDVGGGVGLHPELHDLGELMSRGEAAVCLGVGSGDSTRSHFEAQDRLERASEEEVLSSGWIARHLMTRAGPRPGPLSAIAFGAGPPEALRGASATSVHDTRELVPERPTEVELDALDALYGASEGASLPLARELGEAGRATVEVTRALRALGTTEPPALARYPEGAFGEHLAQAAWLARHREALGIEVISLDQQGWDTHFVQADLVASNAKALGAGLATLRRDLDDDWHETTVVVFTEFGRRVGENVSRGTDHGRASLALLLGGGLRRPGVRGAWPSLAEADLDGPGDVPVTTDYRSILWEVLDERLGNRRLREVLPGFAPKA